jgi:hypothetical protein
MRPDEQEFIVHAWRPMGGQKRNPTALDQDEEHIHVYASGRGPNVRARMKSAKRKVAKRIGNLGYDRFSAALTIADAEKRLDTMDREYRERIAEHEASGEVLQ